MRLFISFLLLAFLYGCVQHDLPPSENDCRRSTLNLALIDVVNATSCDHRDGAIQVAATGGARPYTFSLSNRISATGQFTGLPFGAYQIIVTDGKGCTAQLHNIPISAQGFAFEAVVNEDTDCTEGNGTISINMLDGTPPFEFRLEEGEFSDVSEFFSLEANVHIIEVKDSEGCSARLNITVPSGPTNTSWTDTIRPLIESHCATSGCHNGISRVDLRIYENAKNYATQMKTLTQNGSMPFEGSITQDQIDLIACWVDDGANEN
jgi:hypothetical protein